MMNLLREMILLVSCTLLIYLSGCSKEADEIKECFYAYRDAVSNGYVAEAAELSSRETSRYYANILDLVFEATESETRTLDIMDRILVLMLRQQIHVDNLQSMDGQGMIALLVGERIISKDSVILSVLPNEIGKVVISGTHATGNCVVDKQSEIQKWRFTKEEGRWKIDVTSIVPAVNTAFKKLAKQSGSTENDFIRTLLLPSVTDKLPGEDIWLPLKRSE
jgi:hypothetical protein